jgi:ribosomal protein S11
MNDRVISTFSLGQFSRTKNRRVKLSPATFDSLYFRLHKSFEKKKIRYVILYLRTRVPRTTLNSLVNFLFSRGVLIASVEDRRKSGHGFMRSPKSPRR